MNTFFLSALALVSALTTLTTQALKKLFDEMELQYKSNLLAGIVAILISVLCVVEYVFYYKVDFSAQIVVLTVAFSFLSWLCAMVGYDKIAQLLKQFSGKE